MKCVHRECTQMRSGPIPWSRSSNHVEKLIKEIEWRISKHLWKFRIAFESKGKHVCGGSGMNGAASKSVEEIALRKVFGRLFVFVRLLRIRDLMEWKRKEGVESAGMSLLVMFAWFLRVSNDTSFCWNCQAVIWSMYIARYNSMKRKLKMKHKFLIPNTQDVGTIQVA